MEMDTTTIRKAVGAGRWFSSSTEDLTEEVDNYINSAFSKIPKIEGKILGCISPHAGFRYSGPTAGYDFAALKKDAEIHGNLILFLLLALAIHLISILPQLWMEKELKLQSPQLKLTLILLK